MVLVCGLAAAPRPGVALLNPGPVCQAAKLSATSTATRLLFDCHSQAAHAGAPVAQSCISSAQSLMSAKFSAAEARGGCLTTGDFNAVQSTLTATVASVVSTVRLSQPASTCVEGKIGAAGSYGSYLFKLYGKARKNVNPTKLGSTRVKAALRLASQFAAAETGSDCQTTADIDAVRIAVHGLIGDVSEPLWPVAVGGFTVTHPARWHLDTEMLALGGPITFDTFGAEYERGGLVPLGGAAINITRETLPSGQLSDIARAHYAHLAFDSSTPTTLDGRSAVRFSFHRPSPPSLTFRPVIVFAANGTWLYKLGLFSYQENPAAAGDVADFDSLLASFHFVP